MLEDADFTAVSLVYVDKAGDALSIIIATGPSSGSMKDGINAIAIYPHTLVGALTYKPNANFNGSDTFTFKVNDGTVDSNVSTQTLSVAAVNDVPSFTKGANQAVNEDAPLQTIAVDTTAMSLMLTVLPIAWLYREGEPPCLAAQVRQ